MIETVLNRAGQAAGTAVGAGGESVAGGYIHFMLSPWGLGALVVALLAIRAIR